MDISSLVTSPLQKGPKPYWQVLDEHQRLSALDPEIAKMPVSEFAQRSNLVSGTNDYDTAATGDNFLRRLSGKLDVGLHHFAASDRPDAPLTGPIFKLFGTPAEGYDIPKAVGGVFKSGAEALGAEPTTAEKIGRVGESFPRTGVDFATAALLPLGGLAGFTAKLAGTSALSTYGETGSPLAAGLTAATIPAFGVGSRLGGQAALKLTGGKALNATRLLPTNPFQSIAEFTGQQAGMLATGVASEGLQTAVGPGTGQEKLAQLKELISPSSLAATAVGQLPFAVKDAVEQRGQVKVEKQVFGERLNSELERLGQAPIEQPEINKTIDRIFSGKQTPEDQVAGTVLKSMGENPVSIDLKRPVKTNQGDWNMGEAIDSVKEAATKLSIAQQSDVKLDDIRIYSAIRGVENEGLSKRDLAQSAAQRAIAFAEGDNAAIGKISSEFATMEKTDNSRQARELKQNSTDIEIANRVTPTINGEKNPVYDPELHQKLAIVQGDDDHRVEAGITEPVNLAGGKGSLIPLKTSIIDMLRGRRKVTEVDKEGNVTEKIVPGEQLTADATAAARRAAFQYQGPFDPKNPNDVAKLYSKVKVAVDRAELGFDRNVKEKPYVKDQSGKPQSFKSSDEAQRHADLLQSEAPDNIKYQVPAKPEPDGSYRIIENHYYETISSSPEEAGKVETHSDEGAVEQTTEQQNEGIHEGAFDQLDRSLYKDNITEAFHKAVEVRDPAIAEARKKAISQNVIDYVTGMSDGDLLKILQEGVGPQGETDKLPSIREPALKKARFIKLMEFLRDGGDLNLRYSKEGQRVKVKGEGNLEALNQYMGQIGFKSTDKFRDAKMIGGLNFFEQWHLLSQHIQKQFVNPNTPEGLATRPRGNFAWLPPGYKDFTEKKVLVDWPDYNKVSLKDKADYEHPEGKGQVVVMKDEKGNTVRFESASNPLRTIFTKGAFQKLTIEAGPLVETFAKYGKNLDPVQLDLAKALTSIPIGRQIPVGFGPAIDPQTKGMYHYDQHMLLGTGLLLSPYSESTTGRYFRVLDQPRDVLPHLVHELAHNAMSFDYHTNLETKTEVDRIHAFAKERWESLKALGALGKFSTSEMHGLDSPTEMMAEFFNNENFRDFLKGIDDPFEPLPGREVGTKVTLFDRIYDTFKNIFNRLLGPTKGDTLMDRLAEVSSRSISEQAKRSDIGLVQKGNIYQNLKDRILKVEGDVVTGGAEPVPKTEPTRLDYPWMHNEQLAQASLNDAQSRRQDLEQRLKTFEPDAEQYGGPGGKEILDRLNADLSDAKLAESNAQALLETYKGKGTTLESRVDPMTPLQVLKNYSEYQYEDDRGFWFKPIDATKFRDLFGPVLGENLKPEISHGELGYRISPVILNKLTPEMMRLLPKPEVKPFAPTIFETVKRMYRENGESVEDSEALAGQTMQIAALLKGTDMAAWGINYAHPGASSGVAWMPDKIAALSFDSFRLPEVMLNIIKHESAHLAGFSRKNVQLPKDVRVAIGVANDTFAALTPVERKLFVDSLTRTSQETQTYANSNSYQAAIDTPSEFAAEFMGHVGIGLMNVPKPNAYIRDLMRFVPDDVSNLLYKYIKRKDQVIDTFKNIIDDKAGGSNISSKNTLEAVNLMSTVFKSMAREASDIAYDQAEFYRMRGMYPDVYKGLLLDAANRIHTIKPSPEQEQYTPYGTVLESRQDMFGRIRDMVGIPDPGDERLPTKLGWWDKILTQLPQLAEKYPLMRPFSDMVFSAKAMQHEAEMKLRVAGAGSYEGKSALDKEKTKNYLQFRESPRLRDLWSKMRLDINTELDNRTKSLMKTFGDDVMQVPDGAINIQTPEYMDALYRKYGVNDKDRKILDLISDGAQNQIVQTNATHIQTAQKKLEIVVGQAITNASQIGIEQARQAARTYMDAFQSIQSGDIETAMKQEQVVASLVNDPQTQEKIFGLVGAGMEGIQRLEKFLSLRMGDFTSERRMGDFGVSWKDTNGKVVNHYLKSDVDRNRFIQRQNIDPIRLTNPTDKNFGVNDNLFELLDQIQNKMTDKMEGMFGSDKAKSMASAMDMTTELKAALNARDLTKQVVARTLAPGRAFLDMFDTHQNYIHSVIAAAKSSIMRMETNWMLSQPAFDTEPMLKDYIQESLKAMLIPDSKAGRIVSQVNFATFLAGNLSSMIMQSSHQLMGLAPMLTDRGATVSGSYKLIADANRMYMKAHKFGTGSGDYDTPWIQEQVERGRREGIFKQTILSELDRSDDIGMVDRLRVTNGQGLYGAFNLAKNSVMQGLEMFRRVYDIVPRYNTELAFVASLIHLKKQGLIGDKLYSEAKQLQQITMYPGGKESRPGLFQYVPRSAAQAMWSLQTYTNGLTTQMGNLIRKSVAGPKSGLTPAQVVQSRKAATQMLFTQMALAGALGFPFAQAALIGLQKLFPELEVEKTVRDTFAKLGGDDEALGGWLSSALTTGVPSAMSYAPDMGSRFALGGAVGVSPHNGLDVNNLIGPFGSVVQNVFKAVSEGAEGKLDRSVHDLMPSGFKRIWDQMEQGSSVVSQSGNVSVDDLSPGEQFARTIGFTPARVARIHAAERLEKVAVAAEEEQKRNWVDRQADRLIAGDDSGAQQELSSFGGQKQKDLVPLARTIAKRVEEKTLPQDLNDFGNRKTVEYQKSLRGILGTQNPGPSGLDRLALQRSVAQRLGVPLAAPSGGTIRRTTMVERLLQLYPNLSRAEASAVVARQSTADQFLE